MEIKFAHVSITAKDMNRLAQFYEKVLNCAPAVPEQDFSGDWIEKGTGVEQAQFKRVHLLKPGHGDYGPLLEIIEYSEVLEDNTTDKANKKGIRHIAFEVDSLEELKRRHDLVLENGGRNVGEITSQRVEGMGEVTFVYLSDPEGNIIELINRKPFKNN